MADIEIDLSYLVFVCIEDGGVLFRDGDNWTILLRATGNRHDNEAAAKEILKAAAILEG